MHSKYFHFTLVAIIAIGDKILCQIDPDKTLDTYDGYRFERFDTVVKDYDSAQDICEERGIRFVENAWVVRIKDSLAQGQVENLTSNSAEDYFIGLKYHDGDWYWNDETQMTTENWEKDQGDDANENCAYVAGNNGTWFDIPCDADKAFICQSNLIFIEAEKTEIILLEGSDVTISAIVATQEDPVIANLYKLPNIDTSLQSVTATKSQLVVNLNYPISNFNSSMDAVDYVFVVTTQTPNSYNRTSTTKVSVHVPVTIDHIEPYSIRSPVTTGPEYVQCSAKGIPPPEVRWKRGENNTEVPLNETIDGVYQTIEPAKAILHIGNASGEDHGSYTCVAKNYVTTSNILEEVTDNITLTVLGSPFIDEYYGNKCGDSSSITVIWRPDEHTRNIDHSVNVTDINNSDIVIYTEMIHLNGQERISIYITDGLVEGRTYKVEITACPDLCITYLNNSAYVTTAGGVPNPVTNATVHQEDDECVINWKWAKAYAKEDVSFVVRENVLFVYPNVENGSEVLIMRPANCNSGLLECSEESYQTVRQTKPNRNYTYTVTTRTCSGDSEEIRAFGECDTEYVEPNEIAAASKLAQVDGFQPINVTVPDETNGPISCIFVVMIKGKNPELTTDFTEYDLERLSDTAKDGEPQSNVEYLAVSIERFTINDTSIIINLGNERITSCDPKSIADSTTSAYIAVNRKLIKDLNYTYYTLTSTPYRMKAGVAFQHSAPNSFQVKGITDSTSSQSLGWIAAPVIGGLLVTIIIAGLIYSKRSKSKLNGEKSSSSGDTNEETNHAYWEIPEPGYECVNPNAKASNNTSQRNNTDSPYEPYQQ